MAWLLGFSLWADINWRWTETGGGNLFSSPMQAQWRFGGDEWMLRLAAAYLMAGDEWESARFHDIQVGPNFQMGPVGAWVWLSAGYAAWRSSSLRHGITYSAGADLSL